MSITRLVAHVVWNTRQRRPTIPVAADSWLQTLICRKLQSLDCVVGAVGNADDHVHLVVWFPPSAALADLVAAVKGTTSRMWNLEWKELDRLVWQKGYWANTCDPNSLDRLLAYVRKQREHHGTLGPVEALEPVLDDD